MSGFPRTPSSVNSECVWSKKIVFTGIVIISIYTKNMFTWTLISTRSLFRLIDGQFYDGVVKGKEKAQQQYTEAVSRGQSAGLVRYTGLLIIVLPGLTQVVWKLYFVKLSSASFGKEGKKETKNYLLCLFLSGISCQDSGYINISSLTGSPYWGHDLWF